ncbi:MAG TPA: 4Fe-4S binding protein [Termitinemataceae bacterium]|nr:4Fe-4S binding protein [Termitinemataceae bacterium]HOM24381.1 4Fe-4S binding protein [Termitinemataceae bacterium]HPQ01488.1 4Fe-4S binding protein [Termitinemataceae bacterium]
MNRANSVTQHKRWPSVLSVVFVAIVSVGGYFFPFLGFLVIMLIILAVGLSFRYTRYFCGKVCPNGTYLTAVLGKVSRKHRLPPWLYAPELRRALCGFMFFCMINLIARFGQTWAQIGRIFWAIYILSVGISSLLGFFFKPRAWCALCPMGTLQETLGSMKKQ